MAITPNQYFQSIQNALEQHYSADVVEYWLKSPYAAYVSTKWRLKKPPEATAQEILEMERSKEQAIATCPDVFEYFERRTPVETGRVSTPSQPRPAFLPRKKKIHQLGLF